MNPKISIIIPAFNEEESISNLLSEIKTGTIGLSYEIIVADGGSTDATVQTAQLAKAKVIKCPVKGRGTQMNYGATQASGDILFFLHADSATPPHMLHQILKAVNRGYDAGCFRLKFDTDNLFLRANAWLTRFDVNAFRFGDQGLFVTRELFEKSGGYRNDMVVLEDQEMVIRLRRFGARFYIIPDYIHTSARKYIENGPLNLQFTFLLVWLAWKRVKPQHEIVKLYKRRIKDNRIYETDTEGLQRATHDIYKKPDSGESENTAG